MNRQRVRAIVFWSTVVLSLLLMLLPLPQSVMAFKPYWPALVLIYWALESNDVVSLGVAFAIGLGADVIDGILLGEQALRLTVLVFIVLRFRARLRFFPMWQQALAVLALLANDRIIDLILRSFAGYPLPPLSFAAAPLVGAVVWPFLFLLLDDVRARLRAHEA
ncbi:MULTISPECIES: rod shape-determining protein MreD [Oleiagrimonas]|jgi:rod shape-determining protein MreD|uniref:Rod shape-determining protein MreD n=1 Tax=Oleiagrimonas citrea TaxID=1665687 RepID=A0A846ZM24_9GAMM|nr:MULTISPECIES: rod shape-determining protein MreD [Oleiagrimonas]NKZ39284.1 rod shape-determining protein MreD [Oleiagrimonas citrea]RAP59734.1 rod shape-determining protein MreD [Oleiagrimonas sp. MCCC 1A03011]